MNVFLKARPGKIIERNCSPTKIFTPMQAPSAAVTSLAGLFNLVASGDIIALIRPKWTNRPPSDNVRTIRATVGIMLTMPPRESNKLTSLLEVFAIKPLVMIVLALVTFNPGLLTNIIPAETKMFSSMVGIAAILKPAQTNTKMIGIKATIEM